MPIDQLLQELLKRPPQPIGTPIPLPDKDTTPPSTAKTAFEGGVDTLLGILGVGPETKANLGGQLAMAALPIAGGIKGIPGMYSKLGRAAEEMPDQMTAAAMKSYLMNRAPKEEMAYRSALSTLEGKNPMEKVQKAEILDHLKANPLDVDVKHLGSGMEVPLETSGQPKYSQYTLPGGQNYRETLIKLAKDPVDKATYDAWHYRQYASHPSPIDYQDPIQQRRYAASVADGGEFQSNHWDDPNIIVHVRHNERELLPKVDPNTVSGDDFVNYALNHDANVGETEKALGINRPKGRFIEEVQSDWHQQGRDEGYAQPGTAKERAMARDVAVNNLNAFYNRVAQHYGTEEIADVPSRLELKAHLGDPEAVKFLSEYKSLEAEFERAADQYEGAMKGRVPDAPFKETWPDLALKQQLLDVAHKPDLEWLGWTPGEVQNKRYDLSSRVSQLLYDPKEKSFFAYDPEGYHVQKHDNVSPQDLVNLIGKDATQRLLTTPVNQNGLHILNGEDLTLGGEGMKKFYDERLPNTVNKLLKPFGGKVEQADLTLPVTQGPGRSLESMNPSTVRAWIARLSPEMKARIQKEGLPLLMALLARQGMSGNQDANPDQSR